MQDPRRPGPRCLLLLFLLLFSTLPSVAAQQDDDEVRDILSSDDPEDLESLSDISLEDLLDIEVTSVAKKRQKASQSAAAIYVLTQSDIQRAGARSLPEALRLVPGVEVAQINQHRWAVSIRGFNNAFASKLLVLIDGRSIYTPLFSGVFWNQQDLPIENIERIEIIRGPGGTLWGANAVNGVINIITMSAKETQGGTLRQVVGNFELETFLRYGVELGPDLHLRLNGRWFSRNGFTTGADDANDWTSFQGGTRLDWNVDENDEISMQVNAYTGEAEQEIRLVSPTPPAFERLIEDVIDFSGVNALALWRHRFADDHDITLQVYYDRTERNEEALKDIRDTVDLDFQHRFQAFESHELIWGLGYRYISDKIGNTYAIEADPSARQYQIFSFFIQDEITLLSDELKLIVGSKIEHNDYTGFEIQPSLRMVWNIDEKNMIWAAGSRAVETPSRAAHDLNLNLGLEDLGGGFVAAPRLVGSDEVVSIEVIAFELGWRSQLAQNLSLDLALFYNDYDKVATQEPGVPFLAAAGYPVFPLMNDNRARAETYGFELALDWRPAPELRLTASWSHLDVQVHSASSADPAVAESEGASPHNRVVFRALWDPIDELDMGLTLYWTDDLTGAGISDYLRLDFQVRWRPVDHLELGAGVRNLLEDEHREFQGTFGRTPAEVERSFYFWLDYRF